MTGRLRATLLAVSMVILVADVVAAGVIASRDDRAQAEPFEAAAASPVVTGAADVDAAVEPSPAAPRTAEGASAPPASVVAAATRPRDMTPPAIDRGAFRFSVEVNPVCVRRLQEVTAVVKAVPGAYVSLAVAYADASNHGALYAGPVQPDGTFTFKWTVPPVAAYGRGYVMSAAHDPGTKTDGRTIAVFDLVEDGEPC